MTVFKYEQFLNTVPVMVVTLAGMSMTVNPVFWKALSPRYTRVLGNWMLVKAEQSLKAVVTIYLVPVFKVTDASVEQPSKPPLMVMTEPGILMAVKERQFLKAPSLILPTLLPRVTDARLVQPAKALVSMVVQLILASVRRLDPKKALSPMLDA